MKKFIIFCVGIKLLLSFRSNIFPTYSNKYKKSSLFGFDTVVQVESKFEAICSLNADPGISLTDYMKLPVDQYVCIRMPLDATLQRMQNNRFNLTVPPVKFFTLEVSPTIICDVIQTENSVEIESKECILRGSSYVESLNGCFKMKIKTIFSWNDDSNKKSIKSNSNVYVEVDPPSPFNFLSNGYYYHYY
jgi:hypothetical protein